VRKEGENEGMAPLGEDVVITRGEMIFEFRVSNIS